MSHSVNIQTQFKNIKTLLAQFKAQGWQIQENSKRRTYATDPRREEQSRYVAKNPQQGYDVGIDIAPSGDAYFVCDFFDRSIEAQLGSNLQKIKQGYALAEIQKFMHEEDMDYSVEQLSSGEYVVTAQK